MDNWYVMAADNPSSPNLKITPEMRQIVKTLVPFAKQYNPPQEKIAPAGPAVNQLTPEKQREGFAAKFAKPDIKARLQGGTGIFGARPNAETYDKQIAQKALTYLSRTTSDPKIPLGQIHDTAFAEIPANELKVIIGILKTIKNPALLGRNPQLLEMMGDAIEEIHSEEVVKRVKELAEKTKKQQEKQKAEEEKKTGGGAKKEEEKKEEKEVKEGEKKEETVAEKLGEEKLLATEGAKTFLEKHAPAPKAPPLESILNKAIPKQPEDKTAPEVFARRFGKGPQKLPEGSILKKALPAIPLPPAPRARPAARPQKTAAEKFVELYPKAPLVPPAGSVFFGRIPGQARQISRISSTPTASQTGQALASPAYGASSTSANGHTQRVGSRSSLSRARRASKRAKQLGNVPQLLIRSTARRYLIIPFLVLGIILASFVTFVALQVTTSLQPRTVAGCFPTGTNAGDIGACTFYRGGDASIYPPDGGLKFQIPEWPALITDVSNQVGVPASLVAGLLRVESGDRFLSSNPDYIKNDYDVTCASSTPGRQCPGGDGATVEYRVTHDTEYTPQNQIKEGAWGAWQFLKSTFYEKYTNHKDEILQKFGKDSETTDALPQTYPLIDTNKLRIYSIRDSAIAAAYFIREYQPADGVWTYEAVSKFVSAYYGQCEYGNTSNYCDDVWKSYSNCPQGQLVAQGSTTATTQTAVTCPVEGGTISTHSYKADNKNGHCSTSYQSGNGGESGCKISCPVGGITTSRRADAIDVPTNGKDVILPKIGGQDASWQFVLQYKDDTGQPGNGYTFEAQVGTEVWTLDTFHMGSTNLKIYNSYPSGTAIGPTVIDHVHMTMGVNIKTLAGLGRDPNTDCDPGWQPSDFMCGGPDVRTGASTVATLSCNQVDPFVGFKYYCQGDSQWACHTFACDPMSATGCGPTSFAMVLSSFNVKMSPPEVADIFTQNGWYVCGAGGGSAITNPAENALQSSWLASLGLKAGTPINDGPVIDINLAATAIQNKQLIIGSSDHFPSCGTNGCGHTVVIDGVDVNAQTVHVRDPICGTQPKFYPVAPSWGWKYAYPIGKI